MHAQLWRTFIGAVFNLPLVLCIEERALRKQEIASFVSLYGVRSTKASRKATAMTFVGNPAAGAARPSITNHVNVSADLRCMHDARSRVSLCHQQGLKCCKIIQRNILDTST